MKQALAIFFAFVALLSTGAIFGFFYAWMSAVMVGLDAADPRTAIAAMQEMNGAVRNASFAPAFFGTPILLFLAAFLASGAGAGRAALSFGLAGLVYLVGGLLLTLIFHVPMNESLAADTVPEARDAAAAIWQEYSGRWQRLNDIRMGASGVALFLAAIGIYSLSRATSPRSLSRL